MATCPNCGKRSRSSGYPDDEHGNEVWEWMIDVAVADLASSIKKEFQDLVIQRSATAKIDTNTPILGSLIDALASAIVRAANRR